MTLEELREKLMDATDANLGNHEKRELEFYVEVNFDQIFITDLASLNEETGFYDICECFYVSDYPDTQAKALRPVTEKSPEYLCLLDANAFIKKCKKPEVQVEFCRHYSFIIKS